MDTHANSMATGRENHRYHMECKERKEEIVHKTLWRENSAKKPFFVFQSRAHFKSNR